MSFCFDTKWTSTFSKKLLNEVATFDSSEIISHFSTKDVFSKIFNLKKIIRWRWYLSYSFDWSVRITGVEYNDSQSVEDNSLRALTFFVYGTSFCSNLFIVNAIHSRCQVVNPIKKRASNQILMFIPTA